MIRRIFLPLAWFAAVAVAVAASATATVVEVRMPYKEMRLKDGLLLNDVAVKSFNTMAGTVVLLSNKELISVKGTLLPDEVATRIKELTPVLTKEEMAAEKKQEAAELKLAAETAERRQRQAEDEAREVRTANRNLNIKTTEQAQTDAQVLAEVAGIAEARAHSFFKYQADPHSNIGAVTGVDVQLEDPEPVPGWSGRYRVNGSVYRQYINSQISGFDRSNKAFEMLIQTHDRKKPEIVEIRIK